jgi:hypothetical protein
VFAESDGIGFTFKTATIFTPRGTPVNARIYSETISSSETSRINDQWAAKVQSQDAQILSDATYTYNCHGYTWYMSDCALLTKIFCTNINGIGQRILPIV